MNVRNKLSKWAEERISQRILYVLIGIIALVFVLFFSVGFYTPFAGDPSFNAPLFTVCASYIYVDSLRVGSSHNGRVVNSYCTNNVC